jgi:hypothetical protein
VYNGRAVTDRITGCAASDTEHPHGLEYCPLSVFALAITGSIAPHSTVHEACHSGSTSDSKHAATTAGTGTAATDAATAAAGGDGSSSAGQQQLQQNEQLNAAAEADALDNSAADGAAAVDAATGAANGGVSSDMDAATAGVQQRLSTPVT